MRFPSRRGVYCVRQGRRHINGDGGNPMAAHSPTSPAARAKKPTVYETYLRTDELLALQKPEAERLHSDELTFQIVHQTFELWWKMTVEQLALARACFEEGRYGEAARALRRAVSAQRVVLQALPQLQFVAPPHFLPLRARLRNPPPPA